ncbi:hypothetical protein [Dinghuibacter silviterrae]|uniref:hypothetical protein n=1 Tax=Dinghuibacter silviterrae TaxID=1539049 RepID=UPI0010640E57|nr:hypothetical protein [Dinghuibacter silviterrae]
MPSERQLSSAKSLIEGGQAKHIDELFDILPITDIAQELHLGYKTLKSRIESPDRFTVGDLVQLAKLIKVEYATLSVLAYKSIGK